MFEYKAHFDEYCKKSGLELKLSFDMPEGYESANGTFDIPSKTVYINKSLLETCPDYEQAFYLFHELRHASQYLQTEQYSQMIQTSLPYMIMYDGTCYKLMDGEYKECKLDGGEEYFTNIYLGQPYELDANQFAYEQVKELFGESKGLDELYQFWLPKEAISDETFDKVYDMIDLVIRGMTIREMVYEDLDEVVGLEKEYFPEDAWNREDFILEMQENSRMVVIEEHELIGYMGLWYLSDRLEITNLVIKEKYRKKKYGSKLIEYAIKEAKDRNYINITLEVNVNNIGAIALYKKMGFDVWELKKNCYANDDGFLMGKDLLK